MLDAVEDILREEGVLDELKKSLFLSVSSVVKKQKPIQKCSQAKEFASTTEGKYSLLLVAELLSKLNLNHSMEIFALESGFHPTQDLKVDLQEKFGGKLSTSLDSPMLLQMVTGATKNEFSTAANTTVPAAEDKHSIDNAKSPQSPHVEESKNVHPKKNRSPLATFQTSPPSKSSAIDLESSFDADDKSTASMDRRYFSPDKKKKGSLSPLGPSPSKKSPLSSLPDVKNPGSGLPPLGNLEPLGTKRSPLGKVTSGSRGLNISDELSHDSISKQRHDHLEDSFDQSIQSIEEKLEESKDGFEISDSFENSDINLKQFDSPLGKQQSHVLAPLNDALSPYSAKSDKEKSHNLDDSQPEELASASFLEESEVSVASNMFDDEDCMILESPKKSDVNPTQVNRVDVKQRELDSDDPATDGQVNVNVSTASTVRMTRSQVGWDNDDKERPEDDFEFVETAADSKNDDKDGIPGRRSDQDKSTSSVDKKEPEPEPDVDEYEVNSDFESIEDMDAYNEDMKYNEDENDLNASHASYRSNQEEDEEENMRLEANRAMEKDNGNQKSPSGSLFASPTRSAEEKQNNVESPSRSVKNKSLNDTDDYEDEYGDDFDQDDEEEEAEELDESIAESLEEDFEDEDNLSFGSKNESDDDSDKDKSYMSSPTHSPTGKLPSLFTKSEVPKETTSKNNMNDSQDSDPFQDKSMSFSDGGPETSLASKDDLEDFSVGEGSSGSDEFLKDEDDTSASATELSMKDQRSVGRLGESNDFSMSEHEISGSHNLNEFGVDYTTSAAPPSGGRRGGW